MLFNKPAAVWRVFPSLLFADHQDPAERPGLRALPVLRPVPVGPSLRAVWLVPRQMCAGGGLPQRRVDARRLPPHRLRGRQRRPRAARALVHTRSTRETGFPTACETPAEVAAPPGVTCRRHLGTSPESCSRSACFSLTPQMRSAGSGVLPARCEQAWGLLSHAAPPPHAGTPPRAAHPLSASSPPPSLTSGPR